jgi:hypothetical protein
MSGTLTLLTADASSLLAIFGVSQWGLFSDAGVPVLTVDSVADIEYNRDYDVADYQQEQGAFESYNKVQQPFEAKLGFLLNQSRFAFFQNVEQVIASLGFVTVVTPEISYPSANCIHYGFRRTSRNGVTLIRVEVWVREIRVVTGQTSTSSVGQTNSTTLAQGNSPQGAQTQQTSSSPSAPPLPTPPAFVPPPDTPITAQSTNAGAPLSAGQVSPVAPGSTNPASSQSYPNVIVPPGGIATMVITPGD